MHNTYEAQVWCNKNAPWTQINPERAQFHGAGVISLHPSIHKCTHLKVIPRIKDATITTNKLSLCTAVAK